MATDPQSLLAQANCYGCMDSGEGSRQLMILALLRQIALAQNPNAMVDPQSLFTQAACFSCYDSGQGSRELMMLALLAQIANGLPTASTPVASFTSGLLSFNATSWTVNHNLGATPTFVSAVAVCITNDATSGMSAGDEILLADCVKGSGTAATVGAGFSIGANKTALFVSAFNNPVSAGTMSKPVKNGGSNAVWTWANFSLKLYAHL